MKNFIYTVCILTVMLLSTQYTNAMTYKEAKDIDKPMAVFVYADWADNYSKLKNIFLNVGNNYSNLYNIVEVNIANSDTKEFNKDHNIYVNLPYVLLLKNNNRIIRFIDKGCIEDTSCFETKLEHFIN